MRIAVWVLLLANVAVAAYLVATSSPPRGLADVRSLELNADRVRPLREAPTPAAAAASAGACLTWGPLGADELSRARDELAKLRIDVAGVREAAGTAVWWVHIAPLKSREDAERRLRDLEELGVQDARVVSDDGWRNAVSLGIFRSEEAALAHQAKLRGIKVRNTAVVQRSDLVRFSIIEIADPKSEAARRVVELAAGFAGSEVKAAACASGGG